jgi:hypothetical protein
MERSCKTCEYAHESKPIGGIGGIECRRQPPMWTESTRVGSRFPSVMPTDWCGEYSPADKET